MRHREREEKTLKRFLNLRKKQKAKRKLRELEKSFIWSTGIVPISKDVTDEEEKKCDAIMT